MASTVRVGEGWRIPLTVWFKGHKRKKREETTQMQKQMYFSTTEPTEMDNINWKRQ